MAEFTGERVIPNQVDPDLWNEHLARYAFAARLSGRKRVLDAGCGSGYGSAELARTAREVVGVDVSAEAIEYARQNYALPNLRFLEGSCTEVPLPDASFDLVVAFEVIEHLAEWPRLIEEARRLLAPGGQFIVSTPNKSYYSETRAASGPNPFHVHEFEFEEFRQALRAVFPHVSIFLQNHAAGIVFEPVGQIHGAEVRVEESHAKPEQSHFFVAVCANTTQTGSPAFVYLPSTANVLREREIHIERLSAWLAEAQTEHQALLQRFRDLQTELEQRNAWAAKLDEELAAARRLIEEKEKEAAEAIAGFQARVAELERESEDRLAWAQKSDAALEAKCKELAECVELLTRAEKTVEERSAWAMNLDKANRELQESLSLVRSSRWVKIGRALGLGPALQDQ